MKREPKKNLPRGLRIVRPWFRWLLCEGCGKEFKWEPMWAATVSLARGRVERYVCFGCCKKAHSVPNFVKGFHWEGRIPSDQIKPPKAPVSKTQRRVADG